MPLEQADLGRLQDIVDWGREAIELAGGQSEETFVADRRTFLAVLHCVQIVGEAGWSLNQDVKDGCTTIP